MAGSATMKVEVVSPERVLFSGTASQVITRTESGGEIAFLPGHTSFLGVLTENHTRIYLEGGKVQSVAVHGGYVEASGGHVTILSDNAELAEDIDV
ncbi:MAG: F0F1 ATP synthase subunit epsilon, partial [Actinobacteria bacterium]|nr:F0F1 ATP synthase subunit epsilon [Actinomycetota bacterium]